MDAAGGYAEAENGPGVMRGRRVPRPAQCEPGGATGVGLGALGEDSASSIRRARISARTLAHGRIGFGPWQRCPSFRSIDVGKPNHRIGDLDGITVDDVRLTREAGRS